MGVKTLGTPSADSLPTQGTGYVLLATGTASAVATLDFTTRNAPGQSGAIFQSDFDDYEIRFSRMKPATNDTTFGFQVSTDGGSTWKTAAGSYYFVGHWTVNAPGDGAFNDGGFGTTYGLIGETIGNTQAYMPLNGVLSVNNPLEATSHLWLAKACWLKSSGQMAMEEIFTISNEVEAVNAIRFKMGSGNITSGTVRIYGIRK